MTPLLGDWNPGSAPSLGSPPSGSTGSTWKPAGDTTLGSTIHGNVTIVGTVDKPIVLDKEVFVTGDLVIKGYVSGQGAIYAGRNIYIAGDLVYKNPPSPMSIDGDAEANLTSGKDELRLAARSNLIIGNWTYRDDYDDVQNCFYLNYDYRIRNGGLGFDLIDDATGDRIFLVREKN